MALSDLLGFLIPDAQKCRQQADALRSAHPQWTAQRLAEAAVSDAQHWAAAAGGATGIVANPLVLVPAALADMGAVLRIEGSMAGTIAALLDPMSLNDRPIFEADILAIVFPGAISQALRQFGIRAGQQLTRALIRRYLGRGVFEEAARFATKRLLVDVSERAIASKTVPLVGAGIGAGWNWLELRYVGRRAVRYYRDRSISPAGVHVGIRRLLDMLPWRRPDQPPRLPFEPA